MRKLICSNHSLVDYLDVISWSSFLDTTTCKVKLSVLDYVTKDDEKRDEFLDMLIEKIHNGLRVQSFKELEFKIEGNYLDELLRVSTRKKYAAEDELLRLQRIKGYKRWVTSAVLGVGAAAVTAYCFSMLLVSRNPSYSTPESAETLHNLRMMSFCANVSLFTIVFNVFGKVCTGKHEKELYVQYQGYDVINRALLEQKKT